MPAIHLENLSAFGRLAVQLDTDFLELTRLSGQIERLDIDSDSGLDHAVQLLARFAKHGQAINDAIQEFSRTLLEARQKSEVAAKLVEARAHLIQERKQQQNHLQQRLMQLEEAVKTANGNLTGFRKGRKGDISDEDRSQIKAELVRLTEHLGGFIDAAQAIQDEAAKSNFKGLERNARSILNTLQSLHRKIDAAITAI